MNLTLLRYANYKNRIVRAPLQSVQEYVDIYGATILTELMGVINWNPNDGISATQIFDYTGATPDYCLVSNDYGEIESRWYVMEAKRTRHGQYQVEMLRDVIADYYDAVLGATCFVEKATVSLGDSAIYNEENFNVNQILTRKDMLYDETECPWIVGYVPKDYPNADNHQTGSINFNYFPPADVEVNSIEQWEYYNKRGTYLQEEQAYRVSSTYNVEEKSYVLGVAIEIGKDYKKAVPYNTRNYQIETRYQDPITYIDDTTYFAQGECKISTNLVNKIKQQVEAINAPQAFDTIKTYIPYTIQPAGINSQVGKIIKDKASGIYYKVKMEYGQEVINKPIGSLNGAIWTQLKDVFNVELSSLAYTSTDTFYIDCSVNTVSYYLETIGAKGICSITNNRVHLVD